MPFGSYEESPAQAFRNAARILKETGAAGVKLEGGEAMAEIIAFLSARGIPVMAHVGLTPQAVNALGGYGARGRSEAEQAKLIRDAVATAEAGAFAMVVEGVIESVAVEITHKVPCPTIGIGASAACDGQVLVIDDMLGMFDRVPRFVKKFADLSGQIDTAVQHYAADVRSRAFPTLDQTYQPKSSKN
jgi:3-methyl-2-oxobutanoate hydroxymethyltransferase